MNSTWAEDSSLELQDAQLVNLARSVLSGEADLIDACRSMNRRIYRLDLQETEALFPIVSFESETEGIPIGEQQRALWNKDSLERVEAQAARFVDEARDEILESCRWIVDQLGDSSTASPDTT